MKRWSPKVMTPCGSKKMSFLMVLVYFLSFEKVLAVESSASTTSTSEKILVPNSTNSFEGNKNNLLDKDHNRIVRSLPIGKKNSVSDSMEKDDSSETDSNAVYIKPYLSNFSEEWSKRSNGAIIPTLRFGRSGTSIIPTIRFGRSTSSMIPTIRFGRSTSSMIPTIRFGRSTSSMIPTIRFGRSTSSMIPTIRFGRSTSSIIPTIRFGRSVNEDNESDSTDKNEDKYKNLDYGNEEEEAFSDLEPGSVNLYSSATLNEGVGYEETSDSLDFENRKLKRQTNDSMIPQIRYGRSSLNPKENDDINPPFFILPNIRPGRSPNGGIDMKEDSSEPYISQVDGFLGLFGAFRRSDGDEEDLKISKEMDTETEMKDLLFDSDQTDTDLIKSEENLLKSNKDIFYVIPYPRPGKRQFGKAQSEQKDSSGNIQSYLSKASKMSDYVLPYPRPGKRRSGSADSSENSRLKRSSSVLPYPRPGRSGSILPYPRMGRSPYSEISSSILPYPRLGRSAILPYPRPGRSSSMLPYPRPGRSSSILPYPRPGRSSNEGNYMLPYPRPGRTTQNSIFSYKNKFEPKESRFESSNQELKLSKRSIGSDEQIYNMLSSTIRGSKGLESIDPYGTTQALKTLKVRETKNPIYILPYPRPGRYV